MTAPSLNKRHRTGGLVLGVFGTVSAVADTSDVDHIVSINGGTFLIGTSAAEASKLKSRYGVSFPGVFESEVPAHEVTVGDFRIDRYEVTNTRFSTFLTKKTEWLPQNLDEERHNGDYLASWRDGQYPDGHGDRPVVFITWAAAQSFCHWSGGRLPTEAEWEYVARAGDSREFPWGDSLPTPALANYGASDIDQTTPVGSYPPNEFGIYDLAGNVWEFLYDEWQSEYQVESDYDPIAGGWLNEDEILAVTGRRAVRGASFGGSVVNLRTRWRDSHVVSNAIEFVGFRCAYPE